MRAGGPQSQLFHVHGVWLPIGPNDTLWLTMTYCHKQQEIRIFARSLQELAMDPKSSPTSSGEACPRETLVAIVRCANIMPVPTSGNSWIPNPLCSTLRSPERVNCQKVYTLATFNVLSLKKKGEWIETGPKHEETSCSGDQSEVRDVSDALDSKAGCACILVKYIYVQ